MAELALPRSGRLLSIAGREVQFSYFPAHQDHGRWRFADTVFAVSPWAVMRGAIAPLPKSRRLEAAAFLQQSEEFYSAARDRLAANPLLYYYAFLNLGKALLLARGFPGSLDEASHGLYPAGNNALPPDQAVLRVQSGGRKLPVFATLMARLGYDSNTIGDRLAIAQLLPQMVVGHRQWLVATDNRDRFIGLSNVSLWHHDDRNQIWACLHIKHGDLDRFQLSLEQVLAEGGLTDAFEPVYASTEEHYLQLREPVGYRSDQIHAVQRLADRVRGHLWRIVSSLPADSYRRYYVYLAPSDGGRRLPQIASLWAVLFYLGSIVRYRPDQFDELLRGRYGPFITEFVSAQPEQMLYMLASEMCRREIAKPAIA